MLVANRAAVHIVASDPVVREALTSALAWSGLDLIPQPGASARSPAPDASVLDLGQEWAAELPAVQAAARAAPVLALVPGGTAVRPAFAAGAAAVMMRTADAPSLAAGVAAVLAGIAALDGAALESRRRIRPKREHRRFEPGTTGMDHRLEPRDHPL